MNTKAESESRKKKSTPLPVGGVYSFNFSQGKVFAGEVKNEFGKIAWPDKKHTAVSALVVVVFVTLLSFYLFTVDTILGSVINYFLN